MNAKTDQWKHGGNCNLCRRSGYCKKRCSEQKRYMENMMRKLIAQNAYVRAVRETLKAADADG